MPSYFDRLQKQTFDAAKSKFGFGASYTSADGLVTWEGTVLFENPTTPLKMAGMGYDPDLYTMEYRIGDLDGLRQRVDARQTQERITVDGNDYHVSNVDTVHDGDTLRANLIPIVE